MNSLSRCTLDNMCSQCPGKADHLQSISKETQQVPSPHVCRTHEIQLMSHIRLKTDHIAVVLQMSCWEYQRWLVELLAVVMTPDMSSGEGRWEEPMRRPFLFWCLHSLDPLDIVATHREKPWKPGGNCSQGKSGASLQWRRHRWTGSPRFIKPFYAPNICFSGTYAYYNS